MAAKATKKRRGEPQPREPKHQRDPKKKCTVEEAQRPSRVTKIPKGAAKHATIQKPERPKLPIPEDQPNSQLESHHASNSASQAALRYYKYGRLLQNLCHDLQDLEETLPDTNRILLQQISSEIDRLSREACAMPDEEILMIKSRCYENIIELYEQLASCGLHALVVQIRTALEDRSYLSCDQSLQPRETGVELNEDDFEVRRHGERSSSYEKGAVDAYGIDYDVLVSKGRQCMDESLWHDPQNDFDDEELP